jgi:hypothetical protein
MCRSLFILERCPAHSWRGPSRMAQPSLPCARPLTSLVQLGVMHRVRLERRAHPSTDKAYAPDLLCEVAKPLGHKGTGASHGSFPPGPPAGVVEHLRCERTQISKLLHIAHLANQHGACHRDGAA